MSALPSPALGQVTPDVGSALIFPPSHSDFSAAPRTLTMSTGRVQGCSPHQDVMGP